MDETTFNVRVVRKVSLPGYESIDLSATLSDVPILTSAAGLSELVDRAVDACDLLRDALEEKAFAIKNQLSPAPRMPNGTVAHAPFAAPPVEPKLNFESAFVGEPNPIRVGTMSPGGTRSVIAFGHHVALPSADMFEEKITTPQVRKIATMLSKSGFDHYEICNEILAEMGLSAGITSKLDLSKGQASLLIEWFESAPDTATKRLYEALQK